MGLLTEGIDYGERAQKIADMFPSDQYLYYKSLAGLCFVYYFEGKTNKIFEGTKRLLKYGEETSNSRSKVFGHLFNAYGHLLTGDIELCTKKL